MGESSIFVLGSPLGIIQFKDQMIVLGLEYINLYRGRCVGCVIVDYGKT